MSWDDDDMISRLNKQQRKTQTSLSAGSMTGSRSSFLLMVNEPPITPFIKHLLTWS
jgi:hypothetical protein